MSASNGNGSRDAATIYREHFQSAEHYRREAAEAERMAAQLRAESERLAGLAADWAGKREHYASQAAKAGVPEGLLRSQMSARAKSDYINQFGKAQYDAIPWK